MSDAWQSWLGKLFKRKTPVPEPLPDTAVVWHQHKAWGDTLSVRAVEKKPGLYAHCAYGFKSWPSPHPECGDLVVTEMQSGKTAIFRVAGFERPWHDPSDYFEAPLAFWGYEQELTEEQRTEYEVVCSRGNRKLKL